MLGSGSLPNSSRKAVRHGHQGNAKIWQVVSRPKAEERKEMAEFGCTDVDAYTPCHYGSLRLTQADRLADRMGALGLETKLINLNLTK